MLGLFRRQHAAPTTAIRDNDDYQAGILISIGALTMLDEVPPQDYPTELRRLQATLRAAQTHADAC